MPSTSVFAPFLRMTAGFFAAPVYETLYVARYVPSACFSAGCPPTVTDEISPASVDSVILNFSDLVPVRLPLPLILIVASPFSVLFEYVKLNAPVFVISFPLILTVGIGVRGSPV